MSLRNTSLLVICGVVVGVAFMLSRGRSEATDVRPIDAVGPGGSGAEARADGAELAAAESPLDERRVAPATAESSAAGKPA